MLFSCCWRDENKVLYFDALETNHIRNFKIKIYNLFLLIFYKQKELHNSIVLFSFLNVYIYI